MRTYTNYLTLPILQIGNGKRHSNPLPVRPRKIKRITSEAFLSIKELFGKFKPYFKTKRSMRIQTPRRCMRRRSVFLRGGEARLKNHTHTYEPSNIDSTRNSLFWSWRRVVAWERYINDPLENNKRHKTMI